MLTTPSPRMDAPRSPAPFSLRGFLVGEPVSPARTILVVALAFVLPQGWESWIAREDGLDWLLSDIAFLICYVLCGMLMWLCCIHLDDWLGERRVPVVWRLVIGAAAIEAGTSLIFKAVADWMFDGLQARYFNQLDFWCWLIQEALASLLIYCWVVLYRWSRASEHQERQVRLETAGLATTLADAEIALLEAQIEPHFLFNTLAHVKRDLRVAPQAAHEMLDTLIAYLDRASPALQRSDWTIADELDLVAIYLRIIGQRFGARLRFSIDVPESFGTVRLPALAIATLVENAVRHGLAPKPEGGMVRIFVDAQPQEFVATPATPAMPATDRPADRSAAKSAPSTDVRITVEDDGVGLRQTSGHGLGLATVRARLRSAFGANAVLTVEPRVRDLTRSGATGVSAAIRIPRHA